jgi:hypothetical protein
MFDRFTEGTRVLRQIDRRTGKIVKRPDDPDIRPNERDVSVLWDDSIVVDERVNPNELTELK